MAHQELVFGRQLVHRADVPVGHDEDVRGRDGVDITEGGHQVIAVDDVRRGSAGDDLAEVAVGVHFVPYRREAGIEVDGEGFEHGACTQACVF